MSYQNTTKYSSWPPSLYLERNIKDKCTWKSKLLWTIKSTSCSKCLTSNELKFRRWSWVPKLERSLCCISLAGCFGNVARLPVNVALHGGAPFLVAYMVLMFLLGLPLAFFELGIGQIVQQGLTTTWRAVPIIRGVGYVKVIVNIILCVYFPLYIGLALLYLIWLAKGDVPFKECAVAKMSQNGYRTSSIPGQECLNKTFLESPVIDLKWFGFYIGCIALVWGIILLCSLRRIKSYVKSMNLIFILLLSCLIAILVKAIYHEKEFSNLKILFNDNIDWEILLKADVWYYAILQLFFSTHIGFGNLVTCAGKINKKADPVWTAVVYILMNITIGILSVLTSYILYGKSLKLSNHNNITEVNLFSAIYDSSVASKSEMEVWAILTYFIIFLAGFISMITATFTLLKAIQVEAKSRWEWWHMVLISSFIFFTLGVFSILVPNFQIAHLFDHYIVGNLLLITTFIEITAFVYIYGCTNLYVDFEFAIGKSLTFIWKLLWWLAPVLFVAVTVWALATVKLNGLIEDDPIYMYVTGWSVNVICLIFIIIVAVYQVYIQVDYNLVQKFMSALKASRKWGPVDPMYRHDWIQWRKTADSGAKDFTLKRRGTRDYTHSIKNRKNLNGMRYVSTMNVSDVTTLAGMSSASYKSDYTNQNLNNNKQTIEVVSITDTLEQQVRPQLSKPDSNYSSNRTMSMDSQIIYDLPNTNTTVSSQSDGVDPMRHGPYIVGDENFDHICWRRRDSQEEITDL